MSWIATAIGYLLGFGLATLLAGVAVSVLYVMYMSLTRDLWVIWLLFDLRKKTTAWIAGPMFLAIFAGTVPVFGVKSSVPLFLAVSIAPYLVFQLVKLWAWTHDDTATRSGALEMRRPEAVRLDEPVPSLDQRWPWSTYITDVERAQRRERYEPPPI